MEALTNKGKYSVPRPKRHWTQLSPPLLSRARWRNSSKVSSLNSRPKHLSKVSFKSRTRRTLRITSINNCKLPTKLNNNAASPSLNLRHVQNRQIDTKLYWLSCRMSNVNHQLRRIKALLKLINRRLSRVWMGFRFILSFRVNKSKNSDCFQSIKRKCAALLMRLHKFQPRILRLNRTLRILIHVINRFKS